MLTIICYAIRSLFVTRHRLVLENLALRHQLEVLHRGGKRPRIRRRDRIFWTFLKRIWSDWRASLFIVQPDTVLRWHRMGYRLYWSWKSRISRRGRPKLTVGERDIIRHLSIDNPLWGAPRLHGELVKLGYDFSETTVAKYMKRTKPPSQSWKTFLDNHAKEIVAADFFTATTIFMRTVYAFVVLSHDRRRILRCAVAFDGPTAEWAADQVTEAMKTLGRRPGYLLRDRDQKYGKLFDQRMQQLGLRQVRSAFRCPWQNGYVERVIGTLRRECLDHMLILNGRHLQCVLDEYVSYYNESRTHMGLHGDCPIHRPIQARHTGELVGEPVLGGLHHRYYRRAA
jgi:transposase InsO family protein